MPPHATQDDPTARAAPACSCTSRRSRGAGWAPRPCGSWTGSPTRGSRGGRSSPSRRPTGTARPTRARRPSRAGRGCSRRPRARVTAAEAAEFRERNAAWIDGWVRFAGDGRPGGPGALRPRVGRAARVRRRPRACGSWATCRSTSPPAAPTSAPTRTSSATTSSPGSPRTPSRASGQLWGNPTYDWRAMREEGYAWWVARLGRARDLHDSVRIDHFRAFVSFWAVPRGDRTARDGRWLRGPGGAPDRGGAAAARRRCRWWPRTWASSPSPSTA